MTRADQDALRLRLSWYKPHMHVELPVADVRALLDECECLRQVISNQREMLEQEHAALTGKTEEAADARVAELEAKLARVREWHESAPDWPRGLGEILGVPPKLPVVLCGAKEEP